MSFVCPHEYVYNFDKCNAMQGFYIYYKSSIELLALCK